MERQNRSLFQRLIAAAVSAGMLASLAACAKHPAQTAVPNEPVTAQKAITELRRQSEALGFDNALEELEEKNTATIGGDTYIRLQQHYEGIPVYGKTIVYGANENGELTTVTGNVQDIDPDIDLTPTITPEQAQESIRAYAAEVLGMENAEEITIAELRKEDLYIFDSSSQDTLAYCIDLGVHTFICDAHFAQVLAHHNSSYADTVIYTNTNGDAKLEGLAPIDGEYILKDNQRNIYIFDAQNQTYDDIYGAKFHPDVLIPVKSADTIFGNADDNSPTSDTAFDYALELGAVYDYFAGKLNEPGYELLMGVYNDEMGCGGLNASGGDGRLELSDQPFFPDYDCSTGKRIATVTFGSAHCIDFTQERDLFGHEYTHVIFAKHVGKTDPSAEIGAIVEGICDILGELYESTYGDCNWTHDDRIIFEPGLCLYPAHVNDIDLCRSASGGFCVGTRDGSGTVTDFSHAASTVISHSAYLMWNGIDGTESKRLSEQQLAELWYRAVLMMPLDCDFILCRQLVEVAAQSMENLTDEQRACVREAFDAVGIPSAREDTTQADYLLAEDATLTVYDQNNEPYSGYTLRISGSIDMKEIASNMTPDIGWVVNRTVTVEEAGAYALDLPQGRYTLTITDPHYEEVYTIYVAVSDEYTETNIDLITAYEEPLVVVVPEPVQVADAYYDSVTFEGNSGYYHIPEIICSDDRLDNANAQIYRELYDILDEYVYGEYVDLAGMSYSWTQYSNLVSILVEIDLWFWGPEYLTFNVDIESGQLLTNQEVAGCFDYTPEAFDGMVSEQMQQQYDDDVLLYLDQIAADTYGAFDVEGNRERTLSAENMETVHVFINSSGDLCMAAHLFRPGIEHPDYWHLFNLSGSTEPQPPVNEHKKIVSAESGTDQPGGDTGSALPELTYPISEEACYIIYENWIEGELDKSEYAAVEKTYSPDSPHAYFSLEFYDLDDDGYSPGEMPDYYFEIDLLTGECRTGVTGSRPYTFRAEDYYY